MILDSGCFNLESRITNQQSTSVSLDIRVIPRAGKSGLAGRRGDAFLIRLTAPPVEGAANAELIAILSDLLDVPKRDITIVSGERSRNKRVQVAGITADAAHDRLTIRAR